MTAREIISRINFEENFEVKKGMLEIYNELLHRDYTLLAGRVVYQENGKFHDVYANM